MTPDAPEMPTINRFFTLGLLCMRHFDFFVERLMMVDSLAAEATADNLPGLLDDSFEVGLALETFRIEFVDVLRAGRAGGKPAMLGDHFQAADRGVVPGRACELGEDRFACQFLRGDGFGGKLLERALLFRGRGRVEAGVAGGAKLRCELLVMLSRVLGGARDDLRGEQAEDESVLVGAPHRAVPAQEAGAGAFFPDKAT